MSVSKRQIAHQLRALRRYPDDADFLMANIAEEFALRIGAVNREFSQGCDVFSFSDKIAKALNQLENVSNVKRYERAGIATVPGTKWQNDVHSFDAGGDDRQIGKFDLIVSALGLHRSDDISAACSALFARMKPDGLFLVAIPIRDTLRELHDCLTQAELELCDGAAMRVDRFMETREASTMFQQCGFALPVVDKVDLTIRYKDMYALIRDLRANGATSLGIEKKPLISHRALFERANELYLQRYSDDDGRIRASVSIGYLTGWHPHESQQKPLKPGSAKASLADYLG